MAPVTANHQEALDSVKNVIQDFLNLMVQVSQYDTNPSSSSNNNTPTNRAGGGGGGHPPSSRDVITQSLQTLDASLLSVYRTATLLPSSPSSPGHSSLSSGHGQGTGTTELERAEAAQFASTFASTHNPYAPHLHQPGPQNPGIPIPLITYVENGRNPDVYTREFIELVRRNNQLMRGKMHAFRDFRDVLAGEMEAALPELKEDVRRVVEATGGAGPAEGSEEKAREGVVASMAAGGDGQGQGGQGQGGQQ
ncbi:transcription factor subunit Med10 of mediator complex-domain-containing protein [Pseudoneurospora amorphoporcata]|uniref:Mediator of RNA polymerase II transcription subunit 10 n=1 Tax=Pseudoneurospora amorphoporcata TaxID=241081 RepID=A0AAN6NY01_9PEZI|nr:transcription factor subunit Med10 of mediator complex-domain-containing protein [Pseudoneurospora amorphoporcata]